MDRGKGSFQLVRGAQEMGGPLLEGGLQPPVDGDELPVAQAQRVGKPGREKPDRHGDERHAQPLPRQDRDPRRRRARVRRRPPAPGRQGTGTSAAPTTTRLRPYGKKMQASTMWNRYMNGAKLPTLPRKWTTAVSTTRSTMIWTQRPPSAAGARRRRTRDTTLSTSRTPAAPAGQAGSKTGPWRRQHREGPWKEQPARQGRQSQTTEACRTRTGCAVTASESVFQERGVSSSASTACCRRNGSS